MFIKVQTTEDKQGWWIFEVGLRIHYTYEEWGSKEEYEASSKSDFYIFSTEAVEGEEALPSKWDYSKKPFEFVRLTFRDKNGEEFAVFFNTVAYICNDAGKTIEVIRTQ